MESARVEVLNDKATLEVVESATIKTRYREEDLLRQQAYFAAMVAKGQAGLDAVNQRLALIEAGRSKGTDTQSTVPEMSDLVASEVTITPVQ